MTRADWIRAALDALAAGGVQAVRVEPLAAGLGVTKGSFYWHFSNRQELLDAMTAEWETRGTDQVIDLVNAASEDPEERLRTLITVATGSNDQADTIESKLRIWATDDPAVANVLARVDKKRLAYVMEILKELGIPEHQAVLRSSALYRVMIGEFVWRTSGGPAGTPALMDELLLMMTS